MISFKVNGKNYNVEVDPDTPLLWVIRENLGISGQFGRLKEGFVNGEERLLVKIF